MEVKLPPPAVVEVAPKAKLATPPRGGRAARARSQEALQEEEEAAEAAAAEAAAAAVAAKPARKGSRLPDLDQVRLAVRFQLVYHTPLEQGLVSGHFGGGEQTGSE